MFGMSKPPKPDGAPAAKAKTDAKAKAPDGNEQPMVSVDVKMLAAQHEKLLRLGGDAWIRERIDKAKEPA